MDGIICETGSPQQDTWTLPGRRQRASRPGAADGGALGWIGGSEHLEGPRFDHPVSPGGYAWWYIDGLSDDGKAGITLIAFVGSVFSPYYAWSGRRDPQNHCAINVALYGPHKKRWSLTERSRKELRRSEKCLAIGPSWLTADGLGLTIEVDEIAVPHMSRIRGTIRVRPQFTTPVAYPLDQNKNHWWWPVAPLSRIEVNLERPDLSWSGTGYFDINAGAEPLEDGFARWSWSRAATRNGAAILYDTERRDGSTKCMALDFSGDGSVAQFEPPSAHDLGRTLWGIRRDTRSEDAQTRIVKTLEDTPFYARSLISTELLGERATAMHETLSLDRFRNPVVKLMLPFRMPRAAL